MRRTDPLFGPLLLTLCLLLGGPLQAAPLEIKFAHVVAEDTPKGQMALRFKELVQQRLGGRVQVSVYPDASLYGDNEVIDAMLAGDVQIAAPSLSKFTRYTKALQVFDLPFLFRDMAAVERFQASPQGRRLLGALKLKGIVGHGYLHNGMKQLSATKPLRLPGDAAGVSFRIQNSAVLQAQFEAVQARAVKQPFSEVYRLLQQRQIDGQENTWSNIRFKRFYEVQPYITESNHGVLDYLVVTSAEFWLGLDRNLRQQLQQALQEAIAYGNQLAARTAAADRQAVLDAGSSQLISLSEAEYRAWSAAMQPVWQQFASDIGSEVIAAAQAANR